MPDPDQTTTTGSIEPVEVEFRELGAEEELGDGGKRALDEERRQRKAAERQLKAMQAEIEKIKSAALPEAERAIEEARKTAAAEIEQKWKAKTAEAHVIAVATKKLEDPEDAVAFLDDLGQFIDDDGKPDRKAIEKEIDDLLKRKPHLAVNGGRRRVGDGDGGARGVAAPADDMNALLRRAAGRS